MAPLPLLTPPDMIGVFLMVRAPQGRGWFPPPVDLLPSVWGFPHIRVSLEIYTEALHIPPQVTTPIMPHASHKAWIQAMPQSSMAARGGAAGSGEQVQRV